MRLTHTTLAALLCAAATCASAQELEQSARSAAVADTASTALGLAAGAVELNPLGPVLSIGMKAAYLKHAETLPEPEKAVALAASSSIWSGAAANNLCVIAVLISAGAFPPLAAAAPVMCPVIGVAWGLRAWQQTEHERQFWTEGCPMLRAYAEMPDLVCVYTAPQS
jgi:hypothetical protein